MEIQQLVSSFNTTLITPEFLTRLGSINREPRRTSPRGIRMNVVSTILGPVLYRHLLGIRGGQSRSSAGAEGGLEIVASDPSVDIQDFSCDEQSLDASRTHRPWVDIG
ncbi:hypothetical protein CA85_47400 [Allorhodopirellula solitaria]|uniref:Uncharacterized protein n=1 Tax=Allorhodopirellula solitaria TaxID=2527987 RepID=A0A5C5WZ79_9BACT|nr:hypothetical protein CA85_47400 [Allorhodopirellula solitaria]